MKNIEIGVKVDNKQAVRSLNEADKAVNKLTKDTVNGSKKTSQATKQSSSNIKSSLGGVVDTLGLAKLGYIALATAGVKAMQSLVTNTIAYADEVSKASQKMGVSIDYYQKMASAAKHSGTNIGTMKTAMRGLIMSMQQVEEGSKNTISAYKKLGVSVYDANGNFKNQQQLFSDVLIKLASMENQTERNALATKLLGRSSMELAPLLNAGADGIRKFMTANQSAVTVTKELAKASEDWNDTFQTMSETIKQQINISLTPFIEMMGDVLHSFDNTDQVENFGKTIGIVFIEILKAGTFLISGIDNVFSSFNNIINGGVTAIFGLASGFAHAVDGILAAAQMLEEESNYLFPDSMKTHQWAGYRKELSSTIDLIDNMTKASAETTKTEFNSSQKRQEIYRNYILGIKKSNEEIGNQTDAIKTNTKAKENNATATKKIIDTDDEWQAYGLDTMLWLENQAKTAPKLVETVAETNQNVLNDVISTTGQILGGITDLWGSISSLSIARQNAELDNYKKNEYAKLNATVMTSRRKAQEQAKIDKEIEARQKEMHDKQKALQIANVWSNTAMGIAGLWANAFATEPPPFALATAISMTPLLTAMAGVQTAQIAKYETGGIVGGTDYTGDRVPARVNSGEMILNKQQQSQLFAIANGAGGSSRNAIHINIENFSGGDNELSRLEDMLHELKENGRL